MIKINQTDIDLDDLYNVLLSTVGNAALRGRYLSCLPNIHTAVQEFEGKITTGLMHTIAAETDVNGDLSVDAFMKLYSDQMVAKDEGRVYYNKILAKAPMGLCPLCGHRDASTLDHYLPKAFFPRLAIAPVNLVPACKDCNTGKNISRPVNPETETLHSYFDDIEGDLWLRMEVMHSNPVSIIFVVERPDGWTNLLLDRVVSHFDSYGLQKLYGVQAARELSGIKKSLLNLYNTGGADSIKRSMADAANSWADDRLNCWKAAFYHGLSMDDWFCDTGYALIGG